MQSLGSITVGNSEVGSVVKGDSLSEVGNSVDVESDASHDLGDTSNSVHTSVEVGPDRFNLGDVEEQGVHETEDVESHLLGGEGSNTELLEALGDKVGGAHKTGTSGPTDDSTGDTKVFTPRFGAPSVEESLKRDLGLGVKTIVTEDTVVGRERKDDLGRSGDELSGCLLDLDGTKETEQVGQHESVSELRLVVDVVDLSSVLGQSREWNNVVKVDLKSRVDVVNESLGVLSGCCGISARLV